MRFQHLVAVLLIAVIFSCKPDTGNSIFSAYPRLSELHKAYNSSGDQSSALSLIQELVNVLKKPEVTSDQRLSFLNYGYDLATKQNLSSRVPTFLFPLIKESDLGAELPNKLYELAGLMKKVNKAAAANTLYQSILDNHSDSDFAKDAKSGLTATFSSIDDYILELGEMLFVDPDNTGINRIAAMKYVDACEAYALGYRGNNKKTPDYLFKAAEVAKSLRTFPKSLTLYDWILEKYPNYEKAATALFLKGFIIENNMSDDEKAREIYNQFLAKYPENDLADDVEFLLENLGKSDEEILKMIEEKSAQIKQNAN